MNIFSAKNRQELVHKLQQQPYDLVVIGGGVTGAGIALDAASRGLKTALVEKNDFASGTSSKSTKLIHGGLRYLKQFEIALVREVGRERAIVHHLAPHLVKAERMLLPLIKDGTFGKILTSFGLMVYDVLAGVEKVDQRKMLSKTETMELEPLLRRDILEGGGIYAEYRTDDARLTTEIMKTAAKYGADIINYAEAVDFIYDGDQISGLKWKDILSGEVQELKAKYTISAAGPWVDELREKNKSLSGKHLHPTKGVHIVVGHDRFPLKQSVYFDVPDGRMLFAIPRDRVTYIGTTDTDYHGDLDDVRADVQDVQYLVDGVNHIFPEVKLSMDDVESTWAGLRPLIEEEGKSASELSRKDEIFESPSGLLSIAGGKLTGYRKMAERIIDRVAKKAENEWDLQLKPCATDNIILGGGIFKSGQEVDQYINEIRQKLADYGIDQYAEYLVGNYGRQTNQILTFLETELGGDNEVNLALSELAFTLEHEAVFTLLDFFERRTGRLYFNINSIPKLITPICDEMQRCLGWDALRRSQEEATLSQAMIAASDF